ncbi:MAG: N-glycosylase/DNA lyase [bacterium]
MQHIRENSICPLSYHGIKPSIEKKLGEFSGIWNSGNDTTLICELYFCLLTPQSKAKACWAAVVRIKENGLLFQGSADQIKEYLEGVRFHNNKARYINRAKKEFKKIKKEITSHQNIFDLRDWLVENVIGFGYKEASHFLRNIGLGAHIAILDRHILKNLKLLNVIHEIPSSISKNKYFEIEEMMKDFSKKVNIPLDHLDLLMWAQETGEIFK